MLFKSCNCTRKKKKRDLTTVVDVSSWEGMMEFKPQDTLVKRKIFVPPGCLGSWLENREAQPTTSVTSSLSWTRSSRPAPSSTSCQSWFPHRSSEVSWGEVRWGQSIQPGPRPSAQRPLLSPFVFKAQMCLSRVYISMCFPALCVRSNVCMYIRVYVCVCGLHGWVFLLGWTPECTVGSAGRDVAEWRWAGGEWLLPGRAACRQKGGKRKNVCNFFFYWQLYICLLV